MKQKVLILLLAMSFFAKTNAQKEQNNWFFGVNAGLTWNTTRNFKGTGMFGAADVTLTGIPTVITGSPLLTSEGCFSLSDANGNLLFFSDGMTIWNRNMQVMENGTSLTGHASSAQSGIILPYPNSQTRYIALTLGYNMADNLSYSIVDMTQAGGLGSVEATHKNRQFTGQSGTLGECVAAVRNSNKKDFWVVAVGRGSTTYFNVWKVTEAAGVQLARHSVASIAQVTYQNSPTGYLKFTQDGRHVVWNSFTEKVFIYGDFDASTGIISNLKKRTGGGTVNSKGYGVEFSPNGRYLYLTYSPGTSSTELVTSTIEIYDFNSLVAATNPNTVNPIRIFSLGPSASDGCCDLFSGLQLGPDNRIYVSDFYSNSLFVITDPDSPTTTNIYKLNGLLGSASILFGLPSFAAPWFKMVITPPDNSEGCAEYQDNYTLTVENGMGLIYISQIEVNFGDGGPNSLVRIQNPRPGTYVLPYKYKKEGTYTIRATAFDQVGNPDLDETSRINIRSCALRVNKHIRAINK